jgi:hypothetical protein
MAQSSCQHSQLASQHPHCSDSIAVIASECEKTQSFSTRNDCIGTKDCIAIDMSIDKLAPDSKTVLNVNQRIKLKSNIPFFRHEKW